MKKTTAANVALVLVTLAWPMVLYGSLSQMGDAAPDARAAVEAARRWSSVFFFAGLLSFVASIGLALHALAGARIRARIALVIALLPLLAIAVMLARVMNVH